MENKLLVFKLKSLVVKLNRYGNYILIKVFLEVYEFIKKLIEYNLFLEGYFDIIVKRFIDVW